MTAQQNQQAQVVQQNQQLQNDVILLKARVFDAEEAVKRSDSMLRALSQEAQLLASADFQTKAAQAIAEGIQKYVKLML